MTEHIDIPIDIIETLITQTVAGKHFEVVGGLNAIRDLIRDPEIRSIFEINSASLIHHQANRIAELESAYELFANDVDSDAEKRTVKEIVSSWRQWSKDSKERYNERVKDLVQK